MLLVIFLSLLTHYECLYIHTDTLILVWDIQPLRYVRMNLFTWRVDGNFSLSVIYFCGFLGTLFHGQLQTHLVSLNPCFVSLDNIILLVCFSHLAISSYRPKSEFYEILRIRFLHQNPMQGNLNSPFTVSMFTPTQKWLWEEKLCQYFESVCCE